MITKERLMTGLSELVYVEEGMIGQFANFSKVMVNLTEGMEEEKKSEIKKLLTVLYRDSARHKETIDNLVQEIEKSARDEY